MLYDPFTIIHEGGEEAGEDGNALASGNDNDLAVDC